MERDTMRFMRDSEKEQLKLLVKACMLEISKLKMDLRKCRENSDNCERVKELEDALKIRDRRIDELERIMAEKDRVIQELKGIIADKESRITDLKRYREYFQALTQKPEKDLTSFQSQIYRLLPDERATTEEMLDFINEIGFKDLKLENMVQILRNLERKGYFRSVSEGRRTLWEKVKR
ncbi:hypothetical protein [Methanothermobacter sp. EMTCatA1]|jgi:uncharacterized coiled-coil protein SlyX|uniref:Uncharacterized protein n=2 Tax=Methanothermobacter thermautotrophicus TaxID=145262 RepID=O26888_METTH|nr:hypothetical protein [Methanothermobacter sp. EMTCatA1]AAB85297.1 unknown [Methanothermobacter thermautotrophicus str. Delta H]MDI6818975.1 hypothetical protein [Methanothermobacter thermautotrophicus]